MSACRPSDREIVQGLEELIKQAKLVSPAERMTVYVGDLEALLGRQEKVDSKLGQTDVE
jgi:hypothetical protein